MLIGNILRSVSFGRYIPFSMSSLLDLMAEQGWNIGNAASTKKKMKITILLRRYKDPLMRVGLLCPYRVT